MTKKRVVLIIVVAILLIAVICAGIIGYVVKILDYETERVNNNIENSHAYSVNNVTDFFDEFSQETDLITRSIVSSPENVFTSETVEGSLYKGNDTYVQTYLNNIVPINYCKKLLETYGMQYKVELICIANTNGILAKYDETTGERYFYDISRSSYYKYAVENQRTIIEFDNTKNYLDTESLVMAKPIVKDADVIGVILLSIRLAALEDILQSEYLVEQNIIDAFVSKKHGIIAMKDDEVAKAVIEKRNQGKANTLDIPKSRMNTSLYYEVDDHFLGETSIVSTTFDLDDELYLISIVSREKMMAYANLYVKNSVALVAIMTLIAVLFSVGVISLVVYTFKEKIVIDKKQAIIMSKIKKFIFDINTKTRIISLSKEAQKMLGFSKNVIKIEELKQLGYFSAEEFSRAIKVFSNIKNTEEVSAEFNVLNKHIKVDIYHIVSKSERIDSYMGIIEDITPIVMKQQLLEQKASMDGLTRLLNRETLISEVEKDILNDPATRKAMYVIDIDEFKQINDKYGHYIGDILLQKTAAALKVLSVDKNIKLGRLGGDEFCVYYYGGPSNREIKEFGALLCNKLSLIAISDEVDYSISCSVGISRYPRNGMDFVELYQRADNALYIAKESLGSGYAFYNDDSYAANNLDMDIDGEIGLTDNALSQTNEDNFSLLLSQGAEGKEKLKKILSDAVANNEFVCYKQPKINIKTGEITSEALSRWYNPTFGIISPSRFILLFERTNSIEILDLYMLEFVFKEIDRRIKNGERIGTISVNQSLQTITQPYYLYKVLDLLKHYDVPEGTIIIEITERDLFTSLRTIIKVVNKLHECGFRISIDDFGSGFTTLSILKDFEVDEIKIDKSFMTSDFKKASKAYIIIKEIIAMAHELNIQVVAEGVENLDQARFLIEMGIDYLQGYIISKPVTLNDFDDAREKGEYTDVLSMLTDGKVTEAHDFEWNSNKLLGNRKKKK